jgi:predicted DNA-binding protein with PD1-like motif
MRVVPLRLHPGDDLRLALEAWMDQQSEQAGCVISGIGSLSVARLRLAGRQEASTLSGDLEILSLAGTLSRDGAHLHIALADDTGAVTGGHLCAGSRVRTTAELVVGLLPGWVFQRAADPATGYAELQITAPPPEGDDQVGGNAGGSSS